MDRHRKSRIENGACEAGSEKNVCDKVVCGCEELCVRELCDKVACVCVKLLCVEVYVCKSLCVQVCVCERDVCDVCVCACVTKLRMEKSCVEVCVKEL